MWEGALSLLYSNSECPWEYGDKYNSAFSGLFNPYSCVNHALIISVDSLLLSTFLFIFVHKSCSRKIIGPSQSLQLSPLLNFAAIFNGVLGLAYFAVGLWMIYKKLDAGQAIFPMQGWLVMLFQGISWLLLDLSICTSKLKIPHATTVKLSAVLASLMAWFLCILSLREAILEEAVSVHTVLNILSFPGSIFLLVHAFRGHNCTDDYPEINGGAFYNHLPGEEADATNEASLDDHVTHFASAGFSSVLPF